MELTDEELSAIRKAMAPLTMRDTLNVQLDKVEFDLDTLRLVVNTRRMRLPRPKSYDEGFKEMERMLGISATALRSFCHGHSTPSLRTVVRLMAWVGYTDMGEFLTEEG